MPRTLKGSRVVIEYAFQAETPPWSFENTQNSFCLDRRWKVGPLGRVSRSIHAEVNPSEDRSAKGTATAFQLIPQFAAVVRNLNGRLPVGLPFDFPNFGGVSPCQIPDQRQRLRTIRFTRCWFHFPLHSSLGLLRAI